MAQLMPLPLTVSCFSKIQIDFAFLVPAHMGSPGQRAAKRVCVCVCALYKYFYLLTFICTYNLLHFVIIASYSSSSSFLSFSDNPMLAGCSSFSMFTCCNIEPWGISGTEFYRLNTLLSPNQHCKFKAWENNPQPFSFLDQMSAS